MTDQDFSAQEVSELKEFLGSSHLSKRTRGILRDRLSPQRGSPSGPLSPSALSLLESLAEDILPQAPLLGDARLDLAEAVNQALRGPGDGWRYAALPPDPQAWADGLATFALHVKHLSNGGESWAALPEDQRGALLDAAFDGTLPDLPDQRLTPAQMALWSRDLRAVLLDQFLSHPLVQDQLGMSATLTGGDEIFQGFDRVGPNSREAFEPKTPAAFSRLPTEPPLPLLQPASQEPPR